jgi:hypothetical protein
MTDRDQPRQWTPNIPPMTEEQANFVKPWLWETAE